MYFRHIENAAPATGVATSELTRRQFLKLTTLAGSGLSLGIVLPGCGTGPGGAGSAGAASGPLAMPFLRIAPDNTVTVISKHLEAGQGVWTGLPAIVAEELDASWDQMRVESAPAKVPMYQNLAFVPLGAHAQLTGGSTAVANSWQQLREAGATARAMLVAAAARQWNVAAGEITVSTVMRGRFRVVAEPEPACLQAHRAGSVATSSGPCRAVNGARTSGKAGVRSRDRVSVFTGSSLMSA